MVEARNKKGETPLHEACRNGNAKVVMLLLDANNEDQSPLFLACHNGHPHVVELILKQPWMVEFEEDSPDMNCLHVAVSRGQHVGSKLSLHQDLNLFPEISV